MGNCCSGSSNENEVNMLPGGPSRGGGYYNSNKYNGLEDKLFNEREILGLRGAAKISIIIRI